VGPTTTTTSRQRHCRARHSSRTSRATTTTASKTRMARIALPRALPYSPMARQGRSPIGRSKDSSGTSMAPEGTRGAYSWGWRTCQACVGQGGRWPSGAGTTIKTEESLLTKAGQFEVLARGQSPPDCGYGWWNATTLMCDYWVLPPPTPALMVAPVLMDYSTMAMGAVKGAIAALFLSWVAKKMTGRTD
jgi:hypothetical protein